MSDVGASGTLGSKFTACCSSEGAGCTEVVSSDVGQ